MVGEGRGGGGGRGEEEGGGGGWSGVLREGTAHSGALLHQEGQFGPPKGNLHNYVDAHVDAHVSVCLCVFVCVCVCVQSKKITFLCWLAIFHVCMNLLDILVSRNALKMASGQLLFLTLCVCCFVHVCVNKCIGVCALFVRMLFV